MNLVLMCRNSTVETITILKQLEYVTKGHVAINTNNILKWFYSLVPLAP